MVLRVSSCLLTQGRKIESRRQLCRERKKKERKTNLETKKGTPAKWMTSDALKRARSDSILSSKREKEIRFEGSKNMWIERPFDAWNMKAIKRKELQQEIRAVGGSFSIECYTSSWSIRRDGVKKWSCGWCSWLPLSKAWKCVVSNIGLQKQKKKDLGSSFTFSGFILALRLLQYSPLAYSGFVLCPFCTVEYISYIKHFQRAQSVFAQKCF